MTLKHPSSCPQPDTNSCFHGEMQDLSSQKAPHHLHTLENPKITYNWTWTATQKKKQIFHQKKNLPSTSMLCLFIDFFSTNSFSQPTRLQIPHLTSHVPSAATLTKRRTRSSRCRIRRETPRGSTQAPQRAPATTNAWRFDSKNRRRKIEERAEETKNFKKNPGVSFFCWPKTGCRWWWK